MGAIKTRRIKNDVIMNMRLVCMSRYDKSMITFCKSHGGFIAYLIRCDFSRFKGLLDLISDDIAPWDVFLSFFSSQIFTVKALFMIKHPKILCFKIKKGNKSTLSDLFPNIIQGKVLNTFPCKILYIDF